LAQPPRLHLKKSDFLVGVDGGTWLIHRLGRRPDLVVGDFDSLPQPKNGRVLFKESQELTDTELAVDYCRKHGYKEIVLVGVLGRRLDHLLANLFLASRFQLTIYEGNQVLHFVSGSTGLNLEGKPGDLVSLIPLSDCAGVTTMGLKWPLQGESLKVGTGRGISNVMLGKKATIRLKKGRLLVCQSFNAA
jgi:thiamine pyrophosphokinase